MTIKLTYDELLKLGPCRVESRKALFGRKKSISAAQALEAGASIQDLLWVAGRLGRKDLCVKFALACAQRVAHLNPDPRVQAALDATQAWIDNPSPETDAAVWSAARSAAEAAVWSAEAAVWSAAAEAAVWSAEAAARSAAEAAARSAAVWSAEAAVRSARSAAVWSAEAAVRSAAEARSAEEKAQRVIFLEIFK